MKNTNAKKHPTHTIFQVIDVEGQQARWNPIGVAWDNKDGKGLSLKFDAYPVTGRIVIREVSEKHPAAQD